MPETNEFYEVVVEVDLSLVKPALVVLEKPKNVIVLVELTEIGVWRIPDDHRKSQLLLDLIDCLRLMGERRNPILELQLFPIVGRRLQCVRQVDPSPHFALE